MTVTLEKWPRLSVSLANPLFGGLRPDHCQICGADDGVSLWREHDDRDKPEPICIALCQTCSEKVIEPHPRLYARLPANMPWPGCMALCVDCRFRDGLRCTHPDLRKNGGGGLNIRSSKPTFMHLDGTTKGGRRTGWTETIYSSAPSECAGCQPVEDQIESMGEVR